MIEGFQELCVAQSSAPPGVVAVVDSALSLPRWLLQAAVPGGHRALQPVLHLPLHPQAGCAGPGTVRPTCGVLVQLSLLPLASRGSPSAAAGHGVVWPPTEGAPLVGPGPFQLCLPLASMQGRGGG